MKLLVAIALAAFFTGVHAQAAAPRQPVQHTLVWNLDLAPDGAIVQLQARDELTDAMRAALEKEIRTWHFRPGRIDGKTVETQTSLSVTIRLEPKNDDDWSVRIVTAGTGGRLRSVVAPKYPDDALQSRRQGIVLLRIAYDDAGKVVEAKVDETSPVRAGSLVGAARGAVLRFEIEPERVGGRAVGSAALVPVCFKINRGPVDTRDPCQWKRPGSEAVLGEGAAVALDSAVSLETEVAGRLL